MNSRLKIGIITTTLAAILGVTVTTTLTAADGGDAHLISVYDQGETRSFMTKEETIGAALESAGIAIDPKDSIEPSLDEELIASSYQVNIYRARPVTVIDGAARSKVLTARQTAKQIADDAKVTLYDEDIATITRADIVRDGAGLLLTIKRAKVVTLDFYGKKTLVRTQASTIGDFLKEKNIALGAADRLLQDETDSVTENMEIRIWREGVQTITTEEAIQPSRRIVYDMNRPLGYRAVQTKGQDGVRTVVYEIEIRDGKEVSRKRLSAVTSRQPQETIEVIGLKNDGSGLSLSKGAQYFVDSRGVSHRETYYDLPMNVVMQACGQGGSYSVRPDGAKVDGDGYIIVAANYGNYPRCSVVETSLGLGKVYDTGGFATRHPHGFDLATDWSNRNGI